MRHGYVGIHSPYDLAHKLAEIERAEAQRGVISDDVYMPTAWSQARKAIQVNYFLNSPDAETIEAERRCGAPPAPRASVCLPERPSALVMPRSDPGHVRCSSPRVFADAAIRSYIQEKAQRNMVEYYRRLRPAGGGAASG